VSRECFALQWRKARQTVNKKPDIIIGLGLARQAGNSL
jgi:hypothetical protein